MKNTNQHGGSNRNQGRKSNVSKDLPARKRVNIGLYPLHIELARLVADKMQISRDEGVRQAIEHYANNEKMSYDLIKLLSRIGMLETLVADSLKGKLFSELSDEERELCNYLASTGIVDVVDGIVQKHIITMNELFNPQP